MTNFDQDFETAIRFISEKFGLEKDLSKPTLIHCIRVGISLYESGYSREICIGALLHDVIEDTNTTEQEIADLFGDKIAEIVKVNTKDSIIEDKKLRSETLIKNCATHSLESAIIKAADILDNINYYKKINHQENLETMINRGKMLLAEKNPQFKDKIFEELDKEISKFS